MHAGHRSPEAPARSPYVDRWTLVGLVLLLSPLLTMAHELLGHALTCVVSGHRPSELGAYYVECPATGPAARRLVAMAGTGIDLVVAGLAYLAWRVARAPLLRLALWITFTVKAMVAAGYWLFSGVIGLGDWSPVGDGGLAPLPHPWLWRLALTAVGLAGYLGAIRLANRSIDAMLGGGAAARATRVRIAMSTYWIGGAGALLVSLFNPHGLVITLISAMASTFGGTAGLFNVAYRATPEVPPGQLVIDRHPALLVAGAAAMTAFAAVLGPTVYLR
ncbi:MAG TPA: hypothetical protein VFR91_04055 [Dyella sp.]|nr:hypothetical protein [Dyella sp.]